MPALIKVMRRAGKRTGPFDLKDFVEAGGLMANDLKLPDGPLLKAAYEHAEEISDPWLFNHVLRSWLFAAALAQAQQRKHDAELLAAWTLLHDIGLTAAFTGEARFEVFGANAARISLQGMRLTRAASGTFGMRSRFIRSRRLRTLKRSRSPAANMALGWTSEV